ncbi:MAG: ribonuclease D, partial [Pseudomonadota bacterium]
MQVIKTTIDLDAACARLSSADYVTVDTEFLRESTYWPKLCLIQMAGPDEGAEYIVDPLAPDIDLAPFFKLMANANVIKVFHAARQDVEIIWHLADLIPAPMFDTQLAAMVCGFGESVSYVNLVRHVTGVSLDKGARFTDWSKRPLSAKQLDYAMADVTHLREVYVHLRDEISAAGRESWLAEEMAVLGNPGTYQTQPEDAWRRMKARVKNRRAMAILMELAAWRERLAHDMDKPRGRILKDDTLYDIANQQPGDSKSLGALRSV